MHTAEEVHMKRIGYLAPQYWGIEGHGCPEEPPEFTALFDEFREKAAQTAQPCWPVKHAAVYYTYKGKCYSTGPWRMDCTPEIFEVLADKLIDRLYEMGAYEMFYSGMLD